MRFWHTDSVVPTFDSDGFLADPEDPYWEVTNPSARPLEFFSDTKILLLLGEPGSGKSTELKRDRAQSAAGSDSLQRILVDLSTIGSASDLKAIFNSGPVAEWSRSDSEAVLYVDSLDESLVNIRVTVPVLLSEIAKLPVKRLRFRIACRTAELPPGLLQQLSHIWEEEANTLHLAPLRSCDVISAAKDFGVIDIATFMEGIVSKGVVGFALNPITLRFLAETYKAEGQFPLLRRDLFLRGIKALCKDPRDDLRTANIVSEARADEHFSICARLAAVSVFSNRTTISSELTRTSVAHQDIIGGTESIGNREIEVNIDRIAAALRTAVFGPGGRWGHRTYAEFLAAWYLSSHQVPSSTILALITHPRDPGRNITPQLHETAAWLASLSKDVFKFIVSKQPEIILDSDTAALDDGQRESTVSALLNRAQDDDPLFYLDRRMWIRYARLRHASLVDQLSLWITDRSRGSMARYVAIQIAHACELDAVNEDLVRIALDDQEPYRVRLIAAITLMDSSDSQSKAYLVPLALRDNSGHPDDELKAVALTAVWPDSLSAEELFASLTPAHTEVIGLYHTFVRSRLAEGLQGLSMRHALQWISQQPGRAAVWRPFGDLIDAIMWKAWNELDNSPVLIDDFVDAVRSRAAVYERIITDDREGQFDESVKTSPDRRRRVASRMLEKIRDTGGRSFDVLYPSRLLHREDFSWCLSSAIQANNETDTRAYADLAASLVADQSREEMDLLSAASQANKIIGESVARVLYVELSSDRALGMREYYKTQHTQPLVPLTPERLLAAVNETISGRVYNFQHVIAELHRTDPDADRLWVGDDPIIETPGWKQNGAEVRSGVVAAAKKYIVDADPRTADWIGTGRVAYSAIWGHHAFELLLSQDEHWLLSLDDAHWSKWTGANVHSHHMHDTKDRILKLNYSKAPNEVADAFCKELKGEAQRGGLTIDRITDVVWDDNIKSCLVNLIQQDESSAQTVATLLRDLFSRERAFAFDTSIELFHRNYKNTDRRKHAVAIAAAMFFGASRESWPVLWPIFKDDDSFGRDVIEDSVHGFDSSVILRELTEQQLAELFVWLNSNHSIPSNGGAAMTPADSVYFFHSSILESLKSRQTFDAVDALRWIQAQSPDLSWIRIHVRQAEALARGGTWMPPGPSELLSVLLHHEYRLVESGSDLRDVVIESLGRLSSELRAETPAIDDLWDEVSRDQYRPKDETHLSNYVKRHLSRDLPKIVIGREVEIESSYGVEAEYPDLHIDAIVQSTDGRPNRVSAIIETKGCWHEDLWSAMREQLANRYLSHGTCSDGIYLVGWYNCEAWDSSDSRARKAPSISIDEARIRFAQQARDLSREALHIQSFVLDCSLAAGRSKVSATRPGARGGKKKLGKSPKKIAKGNRTSKRIAKRPGNSKRGRKNDSGRT